MVQKNFGGHDSLGTVRLGGRRPRRRKSMVEGGAGGNEPSVWG